MWEKKDNYYFLMNFGKIFGIFFNFKNQYKLNFIFLRYKNELIKRFK